MQRSTIKLIKPHYFQFDWKKIKFNLKHCFVAIWCKSILNEHDLSYLKFKKLSFSSYGFSGVVSYNFCYKSDFMMNLEINFSILMNLKYIAVPLTNIEFIIMNIHINKISNILLIENLVHNRSNAFHTNTKWLSLTFL